MIGSNEFKLKQGFRLLYNNTVYGVFSEYRMEKAKQYLLNTQMPVSEIALQIGFELQSSFRKAFKRHFLMPPLNIGTANKRDEINRNWSKTRFIFYLYKR